MSQMSDIDMVTDNDDKIMTLAKIIIFEKNHATLGHQDSIIILAAAASSRCAGE